MCLYTLTNFTIYNFSLLVFFRNSLFTAVNLEIISPIRILPDFEFGNKSKRKFSWCMLRCLAMVICFEHSLISLGM